MKTEKLLFVGGVADGHVRPVPEKDFYHNVPVVKEAKDSTGENFEAAVIISHYRRVRFVFAENAFGHRDYVDFFVHQPMTDAEAFIKLIKNYKPDNNLS